MFDVSPSAIVTLMVWSSVESESSSFTETVMPPVGAAWSRLTVQVKVPPSSTVVGQEVSVAVGVDWAVVVDVKRSASEKAARRPIVASIRICLLDSEG